MLLILVHLWISECIRTGWFIFHSYRIRNLSSIRLEVVSVGDVVDVKVMSVDLQKQRIQLTMKL